MWHLNRTVLLKLFRPFSKDILQIFEKGKLNSLDDEGDCGFICKWWGSMCIISSAFGTVELIISMLTHQKTLMNSTNNYKTSLDTGQSLFDVSYKKRQTFKLEVFPPKNHWRVPLWMNPIELDDCSKSSLVNVVSLPQNKLLPLREQCVRLSFGPLIGVGIQKRPTSR